MESLQLENIKAKLMRGPYAEKKKIYPVLKGLTENEIDIIFSDKSVLDRIINNRDDSLLSMVFRYGGIKTQEAIWENVDCQKRLLGIGRTKDDELFQTILDNKFYNSRELEKKKKAGKFYFSKERMRLFELFLRTIKSPRIFDSLSSNLYFQMIVLFSKKVPIQVFKNVDTTKLFYNVVNGPLYDYAIPRHKTTFTSLMNSFCPELLLPKDYLQIFTETKCSAYYYDRDKKSIGNMIKGKLYSLDRANKKLDLSLESISRLSIRDLMILQGTDLDSVDKEELKNVIINIIGEAIKDGSILSPKFLDFELLDNNAYFSIFKTIMQVMINGDSCNEFLNYIFDRLFQEHYSKEEKDKALPLLKNCLLNANKDTLVALFTRPTDIKSMFFIRFGLSSRYMDYLNGISPIQILNLNVKHINKIASYLEDDIQDEISDIYSKAIKLYFTFGLDRTISILKGEYGDVSKQFLDNVSKLIVKDIPFRQNGKGFEPVLNEDFLTFMFKSGQIKQLFNSEANMSKNWHYLYNNLDDIKEMCHGHLSFSKVEIILKEKLNNVNYPLPPNCHQLEDVMQEIGVGNKSRHKTNDVYDETVRVYQKQLKRIDSTIPYVSGKSKNGYRYETMKLHDLLGYVLGYRASCCIRVLDIAHNHLLHALLCESGRILVIYKDDVPVAFSPLKRNGELLIANSIECIARSEYENIQDTFMDGILAIVNRTCESDERIKVATIGRNSYNKPESTQWPSFVPTPTILEKNDEVYKNTDEYHKDLNIIYQEPKSSLYSLVYGKSKIKYQDPRSKVMVCDFRCEDDFLDQQKALNVINGVNYDLLSNEEKKVFRKINSHGLECAFYGEDWYVFIDRDHSVSYKCMMNDSRARDEMNAAISLVKEALSKKNVKELVLKLKEKRV